MPDLELATDLDRLRRSAGFTLRDLVKASGVPRSTLGDALGGRRAPRLETVVAIARACGADVEVWRRRWADTSVARADPRPAGRGPAADVQAPGQVAGLPREPHGFTGREAELLRLGDGGRWLVHGSAGVGKTALAVRWARDAVDRFPDGQLFLNLRGHHPSLPPLSPLEVLGRLLAALGVAPESAPPDLDERSALWRSSTAGRRVLIVLDDAADAEQVRPVLTGGDAALVVTSRRRLAGLLGVDGVSGIALDVLPAGDSTRVLALTAGAARVAAERTAAGQVAALCGHLPLALRLAGAVLAVDPTRPVADLARALAGAGRLDALAGRTSRSPLDAAFEQSYAALDEPTRTVFRRLAAGPGPDFGNQTATVLAGLDRSRVVAALAGLLEAHLVEPCHAGRYRMHDLVRDYAIRRGDGAERDAARRRLLDWYLDSAAAVSARLDPAGARFWFDGALRSSWEPSADEAGAWLAAEQRSLVAVIEEDGHHGSGEAAWALVDLLGTVLLRRRDTADLVVAAGAGLAAATRQHNDRAAAVMRLNRAWLRWRAGDMAAAIEDFTLARRTFRLTGERRGEAAALLGLTAPCAMGGDLEQARTHATAALALYRALGDRHGQATTLNALANVANRLADFATAVDCFTECVDLLREQQSWGNVAIGLGNLTLAGVLLGSVRDAAAHSEEGLQVARDVGDRYAEALCLINGALAREQFGDLDEALTWAQAGLAAAQQLGDPSFEGSARDALATVCARLGLPDADAHRARALDLARETGDRVAEAEALVGSGRHLLARACAGRPATLVAALDVATQALAQAREGGGRGVEADALGLLAAVRLAAGDPAGAAADARAALDQHLVSGARLGAARARVVLGQALLTRGGPEAAGREWRAALAAFTDAAVPEADEVRALLADLGLAADSPRLTSFA